MSLGIERVGDVECIENALSGGLVFEIKIAIDERGGDAWGGVLCVGIFEHRDGLAEATHHGVGIGDGDLGEGVFARRLVESIEGFGHGVDGGLVSASTVERGGMHQEDLCVVGEGAGELLGDV